MPYRHLWFFVKKFASNIYQIFSMGFEACKGTHHDLFLSFNLALQISKFTSFLIFWAVFTAMLNQEWIIITTILYIIYNIHFYHSLEFFFLNWNVKVSLYSHFKTEVTAWSCLSVQIMLLATTTPNESLYCQCVSLFFILAVLFRLKHSSLGT